MAKSGRTIPQKHGEGIIENGKLYVSSSTFSRMQRAAALMAIEFPNSMEAGGRKVIEEAWVDKTYDQLKAEHPDGLIVVVDREMR